MARLVESWRRILVSRQSSEVDQELRGGLVRAAGSCRSSVVAGEEGRRRWGEKLSYGPKHASNDLESFIGMHRTRIRGFFTFEACRSPQMTSSYVWQLQEAGCGAAEGEEAAR